jgi:hypothetical protein
MPRAPARRGSVVSDGFRTPRSMPLTKSSIDAGVERELPSAQRRQIWSRSSLSSGEFWWRIRLLLWIDRYLHRPVRWLPDVGFVPLSGEGRR